MELKAEQQGRVNRTRVLLYWWEIDSRPELLDPFHFPNGGVDVYHIWHMSEKKRNAFVSPFHSLYWYDYKTPFELLRKIKPDKIIIANGESLYEVALIIAAKSMNIPIFCMQHGIVLPLYFQRTEVFEVSRSVSKIGHHIRIIIFYLSVLGKVPAAERNKMLRLIPAFLKFSNFSALQKNIFPSRMPSKYICFTKSNGRYYRERDNAGDEDLLEIGIPFFDVFFQSDKTDQVDNGKYVLMIDTVISRTRQPVMEMNQYYKEVNDYCVAKGYRLLIKLHPSAYSYEGLLEHPNLTYLKKITQSEIASMARKAEQIFSFFSTLVFPLLFVNPRIVALNHDEHYFPEELVGKGKLQTAEVGKGISIKVDDRFEYDAGFLKEIESRYLYAADGRSKERLYQIIKN